MCKDDNRKPGYLAWLPASYQQLGPEQIPDLDKILCRGNGATTDQPSIVFRVRTPNVRCRTRVAISLEPDPGTTNTDVDAVANTALIAGTADLWVAMKTASRGGRRKNTPTRNIVGTAAAPLAIPTDTRLWGYEWEIETNGHELRGLFVPPAGAVAAPPYTWRVVVNYESVERLSREEWNQFLGQFGVDVSPEEVTLT